MVGMNKKIVQILHLIQRFGPTLDVVVPGFNSTVYSLNFMAEDENIITTISDLKTMVNTLPSSVLGLEHDIDGVYNYDDSLFKN
jgi:hypothetical protein